MVNAVFVAPYFATTTLRFIDAAASLPDVRLGLVSEDPEQKLPAELRHKLAAHYRVEDGLTANGLRVAVEAMKVGLGSVDRLIGTLEQLQVPLGELRDELDLAGLRADAARNFRDKAQMKTVLRAAGLPCARHRLASQTAEVIAFVQEVGFPIIVKPPAGAGAQGTYRLDDGDALTSCLSSMPPTPERPVLVEEFIAGEEHSFDSVVLGGHVVWHSINDYTPAPIEVLRHPWIQWSVLSPREVDDPAYAPIRDVAEPALKVLGLHDGLSHMEWFRREDGRIAISEVGARPPGAQFATLLSYAYDFDFYRAWAELMVRDVWEPPPRQYAVGAVYLRAQGKGERIGAVHGLAEAQREVGELVVEAKLPREGQAPSGTYEGDGYVILRHPETATVRDALRRLVERIYVELS